MSRSRAQSGPTISLFPFLAVLLCTMGSLLVVLVIFSRSAKLAGIAAAEKAREAAAAAVAGERQELELAREELGWRIDHVRSMRDRTADDLAKARMQLAGTEENARQLADELDALARVVEALESEAAQADDQTILELERKLAEARKAYDEAKEKLAEKPPAYAVVPYEGANGTHRRPLYIECCIDGVFLQPEGIRFGPADFEGPPGPGNPLASALRAAREHIAKNPGESGDPNVQPYPLLIVRPSGVMAYYAARESIQSWGSEFGYQFVDEDWTLTYPPRDTALADAEMRAIEEARRRLEWLAQVRPPKRTKPATQYRAATTRGGVVSNSGPSVLGDQSRFDWTEDKAGGNAGGPPGRGFSAGGGSGDGSGDGALASGEGGGDAILGNRYAGPSKFYSGGAAGGGGPGGGDGLTAGGSGGGAAAGNGGSVGPGLAQGGGPYDASAGRDGMGPGGLAASGAAGGASADGDSQGTASGVPGSSPAGSGASEGATGSAAGGGQAASGMAAGTAGGAGGAEGTSTAGGAGAGGSGGSGGSGSGPSMPGLAQGGGAGAASAAGASGASASMTASLAGKRGSNWASLATAETPVPLTRPIKVECAAYEFRILADGGRVESRIPIGTHTVDSVDLVVREVHATVGRWGLAGDRMYWKPELVLSSTPDGAGRREDLEKLLADSGIDTRRSEVKDKVRYLPPVQRTGSLFPRR
ncbi:MAG: hypothetical protein WCO76_12255 [Planctomycetota bacterium]